MSILRTGEIGKPLKEIIGELGNKDYPLIMERCLWNYNGEEQDDLFGYYKYENGALESLDGDIYSLDSLYIKWKEFDNNRDTCLCVYKQGVLEETNNGN